MGPNGDLETPRCDVMEKAEGVEEIGLAGGVGPHQEGPARELDVDLPEVAPVFEPEPGEAEGSFCGLGHWSLRSQPYLTPGMTRGGDKPRPYENGEPAGTYAARIIRSATARLNRTGSGSSPPSAIRP